VNAIRQYYNRRKTGINLLVILLLAVTAFYLLPQFFMSLPKGHDIYFHMYRLESVGAEIKNGNIGARLYSNVYRGYGYAAPMFYGDWLLYPFGLLIALGADVLTAYTAYVVSITFLTAISMFLCSKYIFDSSRAAFVTTVCYVFSSYFFTDMLYRHAMGEYQAFIFLPIVMAGMHSVLFGDCKRWYLLGLGLTGVMISHILTSVATVVFLVLMTVCSVRKIIKQPKRLLYIGFAALIFFASAATFIFPMIEQMQSTLFVSTDGTSATKYGTLAERAMPSFASLFNPLNTQLQDDSEWWYPNGIGFAFILPLAVRIIDAIKRRKYQTQTWVYLGLGAVALFMTSCYFPWQALQKLCGIMQFPWRLLVFATLYLALFTGAVTKEIEGRDSYFTYSCAVITLTVVCLTMCVLPKYNSYIKYEMQNKELDYDYEYNIGVGEYLPSGSNRAYFIGKANGDVRTYSNNLTSSKLSTERVGETVVAKFEGNDYSDTYLDLPLIMYKGYKVTLTTEQGTVTLTAEYSENNTVRCYIPEGVTSGTVTAVYAGTAVQKVSAVVTLLTFILFFAYLIIIKRKAPKPSRTDTPAPSVSE